MGSLPFATWRTRVVGSGMADATRLQNYTTTPCLVHVATFWRGTIPQTCCRRGAWTARWTPGGWRFAARCVRCRTACSGMRAWANAYGRFCSYIADSGFTCRAFVRVARIGHVQLLLPHYPGETVLPTVVTFSALQLIHGCSIATTMYS